MRLINGRKISEVLADLTAEFPKQDMKFFDERPDQPYFGIEVYQKRLAEAVGVLNYSFTVKDIQIVTNGPQQNVVVNGELTLYDDEGSVVASRGCGGAYSIKYSSSKKKQDQQQEIQPFTTNPVKVSNDVENACNDAFKKCCKMFGMASDQLRTVKANAKSTRNNYVSSNNSETNAKRMKVKVVSTVSAIGQTGGYKVMVELNGQKLPLMIWKEGVETIKEKSNFNGFLKMPINTELEFMGIEKFYREQKQLEFVGL